jgi:hypothetical protein
MSTPLQIHRFLPHRVNRRAIVHNHLKPIASPPEAFI